jgi:integrase
VHFTTGDGNVKRNGRKAGSRNKGYFYRTGRGWYAKIRGEFVALEYENGERMRDKDVPAAEAKAARERAIRAYLAAAENAKIAQADSTEPDAAPTQSSEVTDSLTILDVCKAYLAEAKATGAETTYKARAGILFDFCFGLPARFRPDDDPGAPPKPKPKKSDYIHNGYDQLPVDQLKPFHIDTWLQKHPSWKGGRRTKIQAVKRALNYAAKGGLIAVNPIKGYHTPKQNARTTYITPEQEIELLTSANAAFAMAIKVLIRTGARPGCEFAKLTAKHVKDHGERMEWVFQVDESKTKKLRVIRITDPEIIGIVREQIAKHPRGPIFRCGNGHSIWTRDYLSQRFTRLRKKLQKRGVEFDRDCCLYSCRHTYAKRILQGYWNGGKHTNIETLARLMGNTPEVCREHYLQWSESYNEPLWESA